MASWTEGEFAKINFNDERLNRRFSVLIDKLSSNAGQSIQLACEDWAATKAAYRFFDNPKISANEICQTHAQSTTQRVEKMMADQKSIIIVIQDTTYINYSHQT